MPYAFSPFAIPPAAAALATFLLGFYVLVREHGSTVSVAFAGVAASLTVWMGSYAAVYCAVEPTTALWWAKASYLGVPFLPATVYFFTVVALGPSPRRRALALSHLLIAAVFAAVFIRTDGFISDVARYFWGYYPIYGGWLRLPFLLWFFLTFGALLTRLCLTARTADSPLHRRRARAFLLAFAVLATGSVDFLAKLGLAVYPFGYASIVVFLLLCARIIRRYGLVDLTPAFAAGPITATMADPLLVCDTEGTIRFANDAAATTFGFAGQELLGQPLTRLTGETDPVRSLRLGTVPETVRDVEETFFDRHGEAIAVHLSVSPLADRRAGTVGAVVIARDVREQKRAEAVLRESEQRFRSLFQNASDLIAVLGRADK